MSIYLGDAPNPFNLPTPSAGWLKPIADYDAELRLMPSQTSPVYRLMRTARRTGAANAKLWLDKGKTMQPDTVTAFQRHLVAITTIPAAAVKAPPEHLVQWLRDHDITAHGGAEAVADKLEARDRAEDARIDAENHDEGRVRHRASRVGYQYRTGARVSLVRRGGPKWSAPSPFTPPLTRTPLARPEPPAPTPENVSA